MLGKISSENRRRLDREFGWHAGAIGSGAGRVAISGRDVRFVVKAAGYADVMLFGSAVWRSKPFQTFVIACVAISAGVPVLVALYRVAPEVLAPGHAISGALSVILFSGSDGLTGGQKRDAALALVRVIDALLLLFALMPMMLRAGHVGIALAIWILLGLLMIWRLPDGRRPLSGTGCTAHDPWHSDRAKDGTWRA
jgi:hypothetical protein